MAVLRMKEFITYGFIFILVFFLALKNPYDTQSLVPNLEPYPDSLFYSYPAMNLLQAGEMTMKTSTVSPTQVTPPGFTLFLVPFFAARGEVLDFFLGQILLLIGAVTFFILLIRRLFPQHLFLHLVLGILFVTNFYIFTMPSLLMAELITVTVLLGALYLFSVQQSGKTAGIIAGACVFLSFIKFSNAPLSIVLAISYLFMFPHKRTSFLKVLIPMSLLSGVYLVSSGMFVHHKNLQEGSTFTLARFLPNIDSYIRMLVGGPTRYLWYTEKLISPLVGTIGIIGLTFSCFYRHKNHAMYLVMCALSLGMLGLMSAFPTVDGRYISMLIPLLILGVGMVSEYILKRVGGLAASVFLCGVLLCSLTIPAFSQSQEPYGITLKKQVGLNFLHPENPWNYIAVHEMESFVKRTHPHADPNKIYMGTFLPPHYVSLVSGGFTPVPLSQKQEFFSPSTPLPGNTNTIIDYYADLLTQGDLYVSDAYINNNSSEWPHDLQLVLDAFDHKIVHTSCLGSCTIYKVNKLKD